MCWAGKTVFIEGAGDITRGQLTAWLPRWRLAERVHLTRSQMDLLDAPLEVPHAIVHLWQTESVRVQNVSWRERDVDIDGSRDPISTSALGFWNKIQIGGSACLACLTADWAPDDVRLMREELGEEGRHLWAPIQVGWTSARTFNELAVACESSFPSSHVGPQVTDRIVHAQMFPHLEWNMAMREWDQMGMTGRPPTPPLVDNWAHFGARVTMCTAQLDRARGAIRMTTGSNIAHTLTMRGLSLPIADEMRFFVVLPDNPRMRRLFRNFPYRDFVELPVPFLASTIRPAAEARTQPAVGP